MRANAAQCLFWPGLVASIRLTRAQCCECNQMAPSQPSEPLCAPSTIDFPFQCTVTDFFEFAGNKYIIYADHFTGWVEVKLSPKMDATSACDHLFLLTWELQNGNLQRITHKVMGGHN